MEISNFVQNPHVEFKIEKVETCFIWLGVQSLGILMLCCMIY